MTQLNTNKNIKKTVLYLLGLLVFMIAFSFLMVPLYDLLCKVTGLNGKYFEGQVQLSKNYQKHIDKARVINVVFSETNSPNMTWEFKSKPTSVRLNPGELKQINYYAKNTTNRDMVSQAVPSIAPSNAAEFVKKIECFCFDGQALEAGEDINMPVIFYIDKNIPDDIEEIYINYTLYDITDKYGKKDSNNI